MLEMEGCNMKVNTKAHTNQDMHPDIVKASWVASLVLVVLASSEKA